MNERVLITTLTKRMAEELTDYLADNGVKVRYLHCDIETVERVEILRDLRLGTFDVLVGINLLREGLDIPEVSLVAILDADKEGFLRSERSLIQTIGRAARNLNGKAILYADQMTDSMKLAIGETDRRRASQTAHNLAEGITPTSVVKRVKEMIDGIYSDKGAKDDLQGGPRRPGRRGAERKGPEQADQAARTPDAGARQEPGVREGGAHPRPARGACASRLSAPRSATTSSPCRRRPPGSAAVALEAELIGLISTELLGFRYT